MKIMTVTFNYTKHLQNIPKGSGFILRVRGGLVESAHNKVGMIWPNANLWGNDVNKIARHCGSGDSRMITLHHSQAHAALSPWKGKIRRKHLAKSKAFARIVLGVAACLFARPLAPNRGPPLSRAQGSNPTRTAKPKSHRFGKILVYAMREILSRRKLFSRRFFDQADKGLPRCPRVAFPVLPAQE